MSAIIDYRGRSPEKTTFGVPLVTAKVIKDGRIEPPDEFIAEDDYEAWMSRGLPIAGDVVLTTEAPLGQVAQLDGSKVALAQRVIALRTKRGLIEQTFLKYLLLSQPVQEEMRSRATGTTVLGIRQSELRKVPLSFPGYDTQAKIATILSRLDDKIELNRRMSQTVEAITQAIFKSWFVDFEPARDKAGGESDSSIACRLGITTEQLHHFPGTFIDSTFGPAPDGWSYSTLGEQARRCGGLIQTGPFGSQLHAADYVDKGIPVVMPQDLLDRRINTARVAQVTPEMAARLSRHALRAGDVVYSRRGDVERHALVGPREHGWLCGTGCLLVRLGDEWPSQAYLSEVLNDQATREWIVRHAVGATMPNLNTAILSAVPILMPPDPLLRHFESIVGPLRVQQEALSAESESLAALRDALLPKLLSGELVPEAMVD